MIDFYVTKGYFAEGVCRPPGAELIPVPETGEVVVFKDFFTAGLRLPMDPVVLKLFGAIQCEATPFYPEWDCCIGQISMGSAELRRGSVCGCLL